MREVISGKEILTGGKVEVRVSLVAQYVVTDPPLAVNTVESYTDQLYQELQLALREAVASRSIDQLLEAREEIGNTLTDQIAPRVLEFGITLRRIGVRGIVLPGVVRNVFLKEVKAIVTGGPGLFKVRQELAQTVAR